MTIDNLDMKCAEAGCLVAQQVEEKLINSSLGILQHDGVYAFSLYIKAQKKDAILKEPCEKLLEAAALPKEYGDHNSPLYTNLDDIFLAKDILERMLVYARYHAKAKSKNTPPVADKPEEA